jgi:hypothetical protein
MQSGQCSGHRFRDTPTPLPLSLLSYFLSSYERLNIFYWPCYGLRFRCKGRLASAERRSRDQLLMFVQFSKLTRPTIYNNLCHRIYADDMQLWQYLQYDRSICNMTEVSVIWQKYLQYDRSICNMTEVSAIWQKYLQYDRSICNMTEVSAIWQKYL